MSRNVLRAFEESYTGGFFRTTVLGGCHETTIVAAGALRHGGVLSGYQEMGFLIAVSITPATATTFRWCLRWFVVAAEVHNHEKDVRPAGV